MIKDLCQVLAPAENGLKIDGRNGLGWHLTL
jgi:hypothetical protein